MSKLLQRIELELNSESNQNKRAELIAQRAAYQARIGRFEEAKAAIAELRGHYGDGHSGPITVRIMIAEAMVRLFESLHPDAIDRLRRAHFLSKLMKDSSLIALSSAWKAHVEFETSQFESMFASLDEVRQVVDSSDHAACARYAMVLCEVCYLVGERERGKAWFMRARNHALSDGDQASIEALLYNKAAFQIAWFRAQQCLEDVAPSEVESLRTELASARNLQELVGISALVELGALCEGRLLVLLGRFDDAIRKLNDARTGGPFASYNFSQPLIDLEVAYCHARAGRLDNAIVVFDLSRQLSQSELDTDDQMVVAWIRRELSRMDVRFGDALTCALAFDSCVDKYHKQTKYLRSRSAQFDDWQ